MKKLSNELVVSPLLATYLGLKMMAEELPGMEAGDDFDEEALALLDKTLDDIEDLPGFEVPVNGRYLLKANRKFKTINEKICAEITLEVMECLKKDNDNDADTIPGTKFSQLFFLTGEEEAVKTSLGMLKQFAKPIGEHFGEDNLKTIVKDHVVDLLLAATCVRRKDTKNPEIFRARLSNIAVQ